MKSETRKTRAGGFSFPTRRKLLCQLDCKSLNWHHPATRKRIINVKSERGPCEHLSSFEMCFFSSPWLVKKSLRQIFLEKARAPKSILSRLWLYCDSENGLIPLACSMILIHFHVVKLLSCERTFEWGMMATLASKCLEILFHEITAIHKD